MDVGTVQNPVANAVVPGQKTGAPPAGTPQVSPEVKAATQVDTAQVVQAATNTASANATKLSGEAGQDQEKKKVQDAVETMNDCMELMTADLHFSVHEKTHRLMVRLISEKDQKVLREYPSQEFLDMIANLREHIGVLTDKKA